MEGWIIGSMLGTALVVLGLCVVKIVSMSNEIRRLNCRVNYIYDEWSSSSVWDKIRDRVDSIVKLETTLVRFGTYSVEHIPVKKAVEAMLSELDLHIEKPPSQPDFVARKKAKKK